MMIKATGSYYHYKDHGTLYIPRKINDVLEECHREDMILEFDEDSKVLTVTPLQLYGSKNVKK